MSTQSHTARTATKTLPTPETYEWPTLEPGHDPEPLATNDLTPTERTTLARVGVEPAEPTTERETPEGQSTTQTTLTNYADPTTATFVAAYAKGKRPDQIADATDADLETVARRLRRAGVLKPWDDPRALAHLYHEYDHTLEDLAAIFDDRIAAETVRMRMEWFGIERTPDSMRHRLEELNPEDIGLSPLLENTDDGGETA